MPNALSSSVEVGKRKHFYLRFAKNNHYYYIRLTSGPLKQGFSQLI